MALSSAVHNNVSKPRVLIFQRDQNFDRTAQGLFECVGCEVIVASSLIEALMHTNAGIDLMLYEGQLGRHVESEVSVLRSQTNWKTPLILGSAYEDLAYEEAGFIDVLPKPYNLSSIRNLLGKWMTATHLMFEPDVYFSLAEKFGRSVAYQKLNTFADGTVLFRSELAYALELGDLDAIQDIALRLYDSSTQLQVKSLVIDCLKIANANSFLSAHPHCEEVIRRLEGLERQLRSFLQIMENHVEKF